MYCLVSNAFPANRCSAEIDCLVTGRSIEGTTMIVVGS